MPIIRTCQYLRDEWTEDFLQGRIKIKKKLKIILQLVRD